MRGSANVDNRQANIDITALHDAADSEEAALVQLLLQHGADPNLDELDGYRPLDLAWSRHLGRILEAAGGVAGFAVPVLERTQQLRPPRKFARRQVFDRVRRARQVEQLHS